MCIAQSRPQVVISDPVSGQQLYADGHIVKKGDNLWQLHLTYQIAVDEIKLLNQLSSDRIHPGDTLAIAFPHSQLRRSTDSQYRSSVGLYDQYTDHPFSASIPDDSETGRSNSTPESFSHQRLSASSPPIQARGTAQSDDMGKIERSEQRIYHLVQPGENMYEIAERYGISADELQETNGTQTVFAGQTVVIPPRTSVAQESLSPGSQNNRLAFRFQYEDLQEESSSAKEDEFWNEDAGISSLAALIPEPSETEQRARGGLESSESPTPAQSLRAETLGVHSEEGTFGTYVAAEEAESSFYAAHATLPIGTRVKIPLSNNTEYMEVEIVGKLRAGSPSVIALSPACTELIRKSGGGKSIRFYYD